MHYLIIGLFSILGFNAISQGPMSNALPRKSKGQKKIRYTIKKSEMSSDQHADFGTYISNGKMYFLSDRKSWPVSWKDENQQSFLDLFVIDIETGLNAEFAGAKKNEKLNEGPICFSKDGSRVYYTRDYNGKKGKDGVVHLALYTARVKGDKWVNEMLLSISDLNYSVGHPVLSNDGKYLYFSSNKPDGIGGSDIYRAKVQPNGNVNEAELLPGDVNTSGHELFPSIGGNDELYFSSTGHKGLGGLDIFMAISKTDKYTRVVNVGYPVNSEEDDFAYIQGSSNKGFFSSNRDGNDDIFSYHEIIPLRFTPVVSGVLTLEDVESKEGITIELLDINENVISSTVTNKSGNYSFDLKEEEQYIVRYSKEGYDPHDVKVSTKGNGFGLTNEIILKKDNGVVISLQLTALKTGLAVEGATVEIIDNLTKKLFMSQLSDPEGKVEEPLLKLEEGDYIDLSIKISKEGYLTKEVHFQDTITTMNDISLNDIFQNTLKMNRIGLGLRIGTDLSDLIDIKPFYFDPEDFSIRQLDAAKELNKIVAFMNENPSIRIELRSHTDSRGDTAENLSLSNKRAKSSVDYIVSKGIKSSRISGRGYGEKKLLNHCQDGVECTESEHLINQRTEFIIMSD